MRAARFIAQARALHNDAPELQHVVELAGKGKAGVRPLGLVRQVDVLEALQQLDDLGVRLIQARVVAEDGGVLGHGLAQLAPYFEGVFRSLVG